MIFVWPLCIQRQREFEFFKAGQAIELGVDEEGEGGSQDPGELWGSDPDQPANDDPFGNSSRDSENSSDDEDEAGQAQGRRGGNANELGRAGRELTPGSDSGRPRIRQFEDLVEEAWSNRAPVKYKLIRFFDPQLTEGVKYEYRVRVWLADPNNPSDEANDETAEGDSGGAMERPEDGGGAATPEGGGAGAGIGGDYEPAGGGRSNSAANNDNTSGGVSLRDIEFKRLRMSMLEQEARERIKGQENAEYVKSLPETWLINARPTEWSEPTPVLEIRPIPARLYAGTAVQRGTKLTMDMVVAKADPGIHADLPATRSVSVGDLLNFVGNSRFAHPLLWTLHTLPDVEFESDTVVVGIQGGERKLVYQAKLEERGGKERYLPTRDKNEYRTIGESLVMDRDGNLKLKTEYDDLDQFRLNTFSRDDGVYGLPTIREKDEDEEDEGGFGSGGGRGGDDF